MDGPGGGIRSMRSRLVALALAVVLSASARPAPAVEIWLFQRGYIEGGTGDATTLTDAAVAAFEENNPDIDVHVVGVPWGKEGDLKLRTALLARRRIDVFRVAHDQLTAFVPREGRLLAPVGGELTPADREAFGEQALRAVTVNGEVLAWPLWSTALVLLVNLVCWNRPA